MIFITKNANNTLIEILTDNLHISHDYGFTSIFYWYRNIIAESKNIENYYCPVKVFNK